MVGSSGRFGRRVGTRGAWLLAWLTLALLIGPVCQCPTRSLRRDRSSTPASRPAPTGPACRRCGRRAARAPSRAAEYDDRDIFPPKVGSKYGYLKGPAAGLYATSRPARPSPPTAPRITFWVYIDAHENYRYILGSVWSGATERHVLAPDRRSTAT